MTSRRVLVVEDNDVNYELVSYLLVNMDAVVLRAVTGLQALTIAANEQPDLILMDIQLPGMDGLEVTRRLRASVLTREVAIVALSARAMVGDRELALDAGCNGYLTKPFSPHELQDTVRHFLSPTII